MAPRAMGTSATLQDLWESDKDVIVVYNNATAVAADPNLWPDGTLYRPWPQVASVPALLEGNETNLANRPPASIWGMFGESTPGVLNTSPASSPRHHATSRSSCSTFTRRFSSGCG